MADWKVPVSFNPSYHAFTYGLVYQPGAEQNHPNFSSWTEATYNSGVSASYYSQAQPQHQSPSWSPELNNAGTSNGQYPGSVLCLGDPHSHTQSGRLFISNNRAPHDPQTETERLSSDTQSDSETYTSPESLSSVNDREEYNPQANHTTWVRNELETASGSPISNEHVSSSHPEEFRSPHVMGSEDCTLQSLPPSSPEKVDKNIPKQKARTAFSTGQMDALTHRFNMQKYLTPAEMKTLARLTGLTYKQVKTWFQNRRMKLKRHQKDDSWASPGYPIPGYHNMPQRPQFQGKPQAQIQDHTIAQQFRETMLRRSPQHNLPYYAVGYPQLSSPPQPPARPPGIWPLPPAVTHHEYPNGYSTVSANHYTSINSDDWKVMSPMHKSSQ
ncbi:homeobox protein DLX-3-like [Oncorhynchus tshawytscha]|uniref:Homeobox domain-containing protein n=1 Tax=Oncorhynchus tshawytscha TaxID=74940 RepID=A0A8C8G9Y9_ONCTS|nr:homeobox protein DLX-3-like [Oncorhynchus tshawytscha]